MNEYDAQPTISGERKMDKRVIVVGEEASDPGACGDSFVELHRLGEKLEESSADVDPAFGARLGLGCRQQDRQGQATGEQRHL